MDDIELANEIRRVVAHGDLTDANLCAAVRILIAKQRGERRYNLARELKIVRPPGQAQAELFVDGEPFPYCTRDGFHVNFTRKEAPGVTLTLLGETLKVDDTIYGRVVDD